MNIETDKRKYLRFEIPDAYIQYKKQGVWGTINAWSDKSDLINISRGGLCFVGPEMLQIGDKIVSQLFLPNGKSWPLNGEVVWKGNYNGRESAVGVRFDAVKNVYEFDARGIDISAVKRIAALHDAAHIVMACFLGFFTEYAILFSNGNGEYKIDFGENALMAIPLMIGDISPDLFAFYHDKSRSEVENIAKCVCYILIAGGIAENIARHGDAAPGTTPAHLSGSDLARAAAIAEHFFIDLIIETKFLYACLKDARFWAPIEQLADTLLANENQRISRDRIQQVLLASGGWEFLAN